MKYINVCEAASNWKVSERSARNYCATGKVRGAVLEDKTWKIPADAPKPPRLSRGSLHDKTSFKAPRAHLHGAPSFRLLSKINSCHRNSN